MPQKKRKYPSKKKTTTKQGKLEYQKLQMRDRRKQKRDLKGKAQTEMFGLVLKDVTKVTKELLSTVEFVLGKDWKNNPLVKKKLKKPTTKKKERT